MAVTFMSIASVSYTMPVGLDRLSNLEQLPYLQTDTRVHYEGSIDKQGGNADWDWWLYQDAQNEWVLLDVTGPGCLYNFVQHRYPTSPEPTFRFYFDGEKTPRFEIKQSEFGKKPPFVEPLSAIYQGIDDNGRGPIWVIRSFVPMAFRKGCKVTSSVMLEGPDKAKKQGGWGHIMYHSYPSAEGITTFTGKEDYSSLISLCQNLGKDPKPATGNSVVSNTRSIKPGQSGVLFEKQAEGSISAIKLSITNFSQPMLKSVWLRIFWEGENRPAVDCPIGAFFGNEYGVHALNYLTHGMSPDGKFYSYFPMPFWQSARVELLNRGQQPVELSGDVSFKPSTALAYDRLKAAHFRSSVYQPPMAKTPEEDSHIGTIVGRGHVVAGLITGKQTSCEGDVRVYIDGSGTPSVESDGSESWACYGWGFTTPPSYNPLSGYDGTGNEMWSMSRLMLGDSYPFNSTLRFGVEGGSGIHTGEDVRSGVLLYYGEPEAGMLLTDYVDVGDDKSNKAHSYKMSGFTFIGHLSESYEGERDQDIIKDQGVGFTDQSSFTVTISPQNEGVLLRRRSDQEQGRQRAQVYIDSELVKERDWYYADQNMFHRWVDDEFQVPASYTKGKKTLNIKIKPVAVDGVKTWNEFAYWVYSLGKPSDLGSYSVAVPDKRLPASQRAAIAPPPAERGQVGEGHTGKGLILPDVAGVYTMSGTQGLKQETITVDFWARVEVRSTRVLISRAPKGTGHWEIWLTPDHQAAIYIPDYEGASVMSDIKVADNNWHYYRLVLSPGAAKLLVDGKVAIDKQYPGRQIAVSKHPVTLGGIQDGSLGIVGAMDDVRILRGTVPDDTAVPTAPPVSDDNTIALLTWDD
ncbi:MAG: DUF2961 domain-containing protein [Armatimonadota bacterium]